MLKFEELTDARRLLQSFCLLHVPSLLSLQSGISFKLVPSETKNLDDGELHHPTTSATCLSSLFDCPPLYRPSTFTRADELWPKFAMAALARTDWTSEGSAGVYCRCRALPTVIRSSTNFDERIGTHLAKILGQLKKRPERFGIGEADPGKKEGEWYPPNAFHTYWTLEILELLNTRFPTEYEKLSKGLKLKSARQGMLLWARQQLGSQIGLHSSEPQSSVLDSDQLAWSLAIFLRFDETLRVNLENRDFVKQALKCLFSTQTDGTWRHYKPLFHYEEAGNAYCYVFETFAVLLLSALQDRPEAEMIRELLKPFGKHLMDLWRHAESTKIPLSGDIKDIGWWSGHRTNTTDPESWATASVFSYAQSLRRLIGIWCREEAYASLNTPRNRFTVKQAKKAISSRGQTWSINTTSVSEQLWTLFINPTRMHVCTDKLEPDSQPIETNHARSAILFGPPGTSKTTLVRSVADTLEWKYVEIHASHFVAEGLSQVQKTADEIFKQLLELDHAVVLFDEIDELVRERDMEKDAFGRFLTTSMLPKLAELWEARKLLYFVATNHINYFDSAIIRSHRFDALILVSPSSFEAKIAELKRLLSELHGLSITSFEVTQAQIQQTLTKLVESEFTTDTPGKVDEKGSQNEELSKWQTKELDADFALAKFALLRWDELHELANRLATILQTNDPVPENVSNVLLQHALMKVADSQWRKNKSYADYFRDMKSERRDYQMLNVWELKKDAMIPEVLLPYVSKDKKWLSRAVDSLQEIKAPGFELMSEQGNLEIRNSTAK